MVVSSAAINKLMAIQEQQYKPKTIYFTTIHKILLYDKSAGINLSNNSDNDSLETSLIQGVQMMAKQTLGSHITEIPTEDGKVMKFYDMDHNLVLGVTYERDRKSYSQIEDFMDGLSEKAKELIKGPYAKSIEQYEQYRNTDVKNTDMFKDLQTELMKVYGLELVKPIDTEPIKQLIVYLSDVLKNPKSENLELAINLMKSKSLSSLLKEPEYVIKEASKLESLKNDPLSLQVECANIKPILQGYINFKSNYFKC